VPASRVASAGRIDAHSSLEQRTPARVGYLWSDGIVASMIGHDDVYLDDGSLWIAIGRRKIGS